MDSSRTDYSHYSKNSSDLGSEGLEERASQTPGAQNGKILPSCADDLEATRREHSNKQCDPVPPIDEDSGDRDMEDLNADLDLEDLPGTKTAQEVIEHTTADDLDPASKTILDHHTPSDSDRSKNVSKVAPGGSKNVSSARSKNVSVRQRRSPANDAKIIAKVRSFVPSEASPAGTSSVSSPSLSLTHPLSSLSYPSSSTKAGAPPIAANDNLIPIWGLTGDTVKVFAASVALQLLGTPPIAFTFNPTPEAVDRGLCHPERFLDSLKRPFDQKLDRAGIVLPYWFAVDVDDNRRLHIHGAFAADPALHSAIREAMKAAWGEWDSPGKHKQLLFQSPCDDGWATYSVRNQAAVSKIIGRRTFTISHPLRRDAASAYTEIRRIMREDET